MKNGTIDHVVPPKGLLGATKTIYEPSVAAREFTHQSLFHDPVTLVLYQQVKDRYFPKLIGSYESVQNEFNTILDDLIQYGEGVRARLIEHMKFPAYAENSSYTIQYGIFACFIVTRQFQIVNNHYSSMTNVTVSGKYLRSFLGDIISPVIPHSELVIRKLMNFGAKIAEERDHVPGFLERLAKMGQRATLLKNDVAQVLALSPADPVAEPVAGLKPPNEKVPGKLYVTPGFDLAWVDKKTWSFSEVPSLVFEILVRRSIKVPAELEWKDFRDELPRSVAARGIAEAMRGVDGWEDLIVKGGSGYKYKLNPAYVQKGIEILD